MKKQKIVKALKIVTVCVLCGAMMLGSALIAGNANSAKLAEMEKTIAVLSNSYTAQMDALSAKLDGLSSTEKWETIVEKLEGLSSATQVEDLVEKLSALSASTEQIDTLVTKLGELSSADQIDALITKLGELSSSEQIDEIVAKLSGVSSAEQVSALVDKLDDLSTAEQVDALIETLIPTQEGPLADNYAQEAYEKLVYIDKVLKDRDCVAGEQFKLAQKWIIFDLMEAGYKEGVDIVKQDTTMTKYVQKQSSAAAYKSLFPAVDSYDISAETYNRSGRKYVVAEGDTGAYVKVTLHTPNIVVTKKGNSDKTIIVGAHYDGSGTGDNGSSIALAVTTAQHLYNVETEYTIQFVFFTAEEYGMYGSNAYVNAMTQEQIDNTLYMINMDSLVCGDYCYLYGGVQDDANQTVTDTEAYDNAMAIAQKAGLSFKSNPWTYGNPAPGYDIPDYASPSTGDWSDHAPFKNAGIQYVYFEATNWEIPGPYAEYDGYGETYLIGMLMNTSNDYLEYIETYFPGRPLAHLTQYSTLLNLLLTQSNYNP